MRVILLNMTVLRVISHKYQEFMGSSNIKFVLKVILHNMAPPEVTLNKNRIYNQASLSSHLTKITSKSVNRPNTTDSDNEYNRGSEQGYISS